MNPYASILASAAAQAQAILGPWADANGTGALTLDGQAVLATAASSPPQYVPGPNGLERVEELRLIVTKAQRALLTPPRAAPRSTAIFGGDTYWVTQVDEDSIHYFLTCLPA